MKCRISWENKNFDDMGTLNLIVNSENQSRTQLYLNAVASVS